MILIDFVAEQSKTKLTEIDRVEKTIFAKHDLKIRVLLTIENFDFKFHTISESKWRSGCPEKDSHLFFAATVHYFCSVKKTIILYGVILAALTGILKFIEYRFLVRDLSTEIYIGAIALFFTILGIWVGYKITRDKKSAFEKKYSKNNKSISESELSKKLNQYGLSRREHEVLTLIAKGHSNREIADSLFLSTNTVKTHSSNIFAKLDVKRRTQAVQKAKEIGLFLEVNLSDWFSIVYHISTFGWISSNPSDWYFLVITFHRSSLCFAISINEAR